MAQKINGKVYDWSSVTIDFSGMKGIEPTEISYDDEQDTELIYKKGGEIAGYGTGNKKNSVKLSMHREDFDVMTNAIKKTGVKQFYDFVIPKIVVNYADPGEKITSDVLTKVKITKRSFKAAQGDKSMKVDLDAVAIGGIKINGLDA